MCKRFDDFALLLAMPMGRRRCLMLLVSALVTGSRTPTEAKTNADEASCTPESLGEICGEQTCGLARSHCGEIVSCGECAEGTRCVLGTCTDACFEGDQPGQYLPCVPTPDKCSLGLELLGGVDLRECDLGHADLHEANLRGADLRYADLHEADLSDATLSMAFLSGALLWRANLAGARIYLCEVKDADLMEANLSGADLTKSNFQGSCLQSVDLSGANLRDANLTQTNVSDVRWDGAICPDGKVADAGGTCCGHLNGVPIRRGCPA